jgi:hypothetical protein
MANCAPLGDKINGYDLYEKTASPCTNEAAVKLPNVTFYGKSSKNTPLFAVMNYETFKCAKHGMLIASVAAAALGITAIVLGVKLAKKGKIPLVM